ncbi:hypothetical protein K4L44_06535 [Halosquirtibacter laminarini]|uniref:Uncharacterized protein n=1 Tax=Halosquirtibacter laminarini TaxID=3374600 RepID=A0AC61NID3_9BACT|nr:hypothetical protein K4L44_06535 [Prolixibacteraceae bacterium]
MFHRYQKQIVNSNESRIKTIHNLFVRFIVVCVFVVLVAYFLLFRFRKLAFTLVVCLTLKMAFNEYTHRRGISFHSVATSYVGLVERSFEENDHFVKDLNDELVLNIESDVLSSMDYDKSKVKQYANEISTKYFIENNDSLFKEYGHIVRYLSVFKCINSSWKYVSDPEEEEFFAKASQSMITLAGDCDDHTILMCSCIKAIGGKTRAVLIKGHIFPVVRVANDKYEFERHIKPVLIELFGNSPDEDYGVIENNDGLWLNFDYTKKTPGGPFLSEEVIKVIKI